MKQDKITKEKLDKYFGVSESALEIIKKNIIKGKEKEAKEIIEMAGNYISDAHHFEKKEDFVNNLKDSNRKRFKRYIMTYI